MSFSILVVDDEPDVAEMFRQRFRREARQGICVLHFTAFGEETLDKLADGVRPELIVILSDINMPGIDGMSLLGEIKTRRPELPVMMVTAYGDDERRPQAEGAGASRFLPSRSISLCPSKSWAARGNAGVTDAKSDVCIATLAPTHRAAARPWMPRQFSEVVMRVSKALAGALALTSIGYASPGAFGADPSNLGLPEVTVTAPPITPSWKKWNPYSSNPRVEEDKWPEIPCGGSRISYSAPSTCKTGPLLGHEGMGLPSGNISVDASNCRMGHDLVITNTGNLVIEADAVVVDPYFVSAIGSQHKGCYVQSHYSDLREDFPDMNQMTRKGSGWRNYLETGDLSTMEFSVGSSDCRAIEKRGPTWLGGHVYVIHASVCRKDGRAVEAADMDLALGSLQVRQYESRGNLRPPPQ